MSDDEDVESTSEDHAIRFRGLLKVPGAECVVLPGDVVECRVGEACSKVDVARVAALVESGVYHGVQVKLDTGVVLARTSPPMPAAPAPSRKRKREEETREVEILVDGLQAFPTRARDRVRRIAQDLMRLDPWGSPTVRATRSADAAAGGDAASHSFECHELTAHGTHSVQHEALEAMIHRHSYITRADYHFARAAVVLRLQVPA